MAGKWKVIRNPMAGFCIARLIDEGQPMHSGNIEYFDNIYCDRKEELEIVADLLNEEGD